MKVPFILKNAHKNPTSIVADINFLGLRFKIGTGQSINPEFWLPDVRRAKYIKSYPEGKSINKELEKLEDLINNAVDYFSSNNIKPDAEEFKKMVFETSKPVNNGMKFTDYMELYIDNSSHAIQTLKNYRVALAKIRAWEQETGQILRFSNVDIYFYRSFEK